MPNGTYGGVGGRQLVTAFYPIKQMMVASGFERVFEVGHAYRAEEHNTNRHLNEYISMDLEMGFIEDESDIMDLEENLLKYIIESLNISGKEYLDLLKVESHQLTIKFLGLNLRKQLIY